MIWEKIKNFFSRFRISVIVIFILLVIIGVGGFYFYQARAVYTAYKVKWELKREDVDTSQYMAFNDGVLKYSQDGISYLETDSKMTAIWNQTYSIQNPIVDTCEDYAAVAEKNGTKVYIMNTEGPVGEIETQYSIKKISVSNSGLVAALMENGDTNYINYYDTAGTVLVESTVHMKKSGYPMDMDVSDDGKKMVVSYLYVDEGAMKTDIAFYNFGSVGKEENDRLVSSYTYDDTIFPEVSFMGSDTAVAFGDGMVTIYKGSERPKLLEKIKVSDEIYSVSNDENHFSLLTASGSGSEKYTLTMYNKSGKVQFNKGITDSYDGMTMYNGNTYLYSETGCAVFSAYGIEKFNKTFEAGVQTIIPLKSIRNLLWVSDSKISKLYLN